MYQAENLMQECAKYFKQTFLNSVEIAKKEVEVDSNFNVNNLNKYFDSLTQLKSIILSTLVLAAKETEKKKETICLNLETDLTLNEIESLFDQIKLGLSSSQNNLLKNILIEGFENSLSYKSISKKIKSQIGLNLVQSKTLNSIEKHLIENKTSKGEIEKILNLKSKQMLKIRADTFALTQSARAVSSGRFLLQQQMFQDGDIPLNSKQVWLTGSDERACSLCGPMHGQRVGMSEEFICGNGSKIRSPILHPRCRCIVIVEF